MKFGNSNNFEQSYNLQAAVDTDSKMIVGTYPTQKCNDKAELKNCVESVPEELEKEEKVFVCADTGYFSSSLIEKTENLLKKKDNCRTCLWNYKACNGIPPIFDARSRKHRY